MTVGELPRYPEVNRAGGRRVVKGPWDPARAGAAGPGRFLASDADRERVVDVLKTAFVHGLLTKDELGRRTGQALTARTYADLAVLITGLTTGLTTGLITGVTTGRTARPAESGAPAGTPGKRVNKKVVALSACGVILPPALAAAFFTFYGGFVVMFLFTFLGAVLSSPARRQPGPAPMSGRR